MVILVLSTCNISGKISEHLEFREKKSLNIKFIMCRCEFVKVKIRRLNWRPRITFSERC